MGVCELRGSIGLSCKAHLSSICSQENLKASSKVYCNVLEIVYKIRRFFFKFLIINPESKHQHPLSPVRSTTEICQVTFVPISTFPNHYSVLQEYSCYESFATSSDTNWQMPSRAQTRLPFIKSGQLAEWLCSDFAGQVLISEVRVPDCPFFLVTQCQ